KRCCSKDERGTRDSSHCRKALLLLCFTSS
ncbi:hypothetical protein TSMEX_001465, partial [Taenia solium]